MPESTSVDDYEQEIQMKPGWLGSMSTQSTNGLKQKDNGVCLVTEDGIEFAVSEERLSGIKHDSHADLSLRAALDFASSSNIEIISMGLSSCSDLPDAAFTFPNSAKVPVIRVPTHHYSHALGAFALSPFQSSIIVVMDAGGSVLENTSIETSWWSTKREQTSLWIGTGSDIILHRYVHSDPFDIGYGEWFRALTYFLGWHSHTLTGNTMALSAYGDERFLQGPLLWDDLSGTFERRILNEPPSPIGMVQSLLSLIGSGDVEPRAPGSPILAEHKALAKYIQYSFEKSLFQLAESAISDTGITNICLSGGVAQNCVAAGRLALQHGRAKVYVPVSSGDVGQPIGNALFSRMEHIKDLGNVKERIFLGPPQSISSRDDCSTVVVDEIIQRLNRGEIVALALGRSEFGPRALGNRSVLCDPHNVSAVERMKRGVKRRDDFMPLAPATLEATLSMHPEIPRSTTMTFAAHIPVELIGDFGLTRHLDGTARIQVASPKSTLGAILEGFSSVTGRSVLVNTSFNARSLPIAETSNDAMSAFRQLDIDALLLGNGLMAKPL